MPCLAMGRWRSHLLNIKLQDATGFQTLAPVAKTGAEAGRGCDAERSMCTPRFGLD